MQLVDPGDAELLPAGHGRQMVGDDEDELSTKDPAGQVEASAQFAKQMHDNGLELSFYVTGKCKCGVDLCLSSCL